MSAVPRPEHRPKPFGARSALRVASVAIVAALALHAAAWELWLAPLRPGGSMLAVKSLPLLVAAWALWHRGTRAFLWCSLLMLPYVAEGVARGLTDAARSALHGWIQFVLAAIACTLILAFVRSAVRRAAADAAARRRPDELA